MKQWYLATAEVRHYDPSYNPPALMMHVVEDPFEWVTSFGSLTDRQVFLINTIKVTSEQAQKWDELHDGDPVEV